ncbi:cytochrome P450 [Mycobacterium sherrisii]|uniref:cytochrome P450 n=1 Tax=Mycobacterium sherrisii TaxID=243061 RepID=UPI001B80DD35|nr:cytochrome P450 [Mycobacterium sherrisii]
MNPAMPAVADRLAQLPLPPGPRLPGVLQTALFSHRDRVTPWLRRHYGDVIAVSVLGRPSVLVCSPELNRAVLGGEPTTFHAGEGRIQGIRNVMGERSVVTTDEADHQRLRKLLVPPFNGAALRGYRDMMNELATKEVGRWPLGTPFAAQPRMNAVTLEMMLRVVLGLRAGPQLDALRVPFSRLVSAPMAVHAGEVVAPLQRFGPWKRFRQLLTGIDDLLYAEIHRRRGAADTEERNDVLSRLITTEVDEDRLSDAELRDQMVTLLLAGHETTAITLSWTLHDLAHDPALQDKTIAAVDTGDDKFLEAVVKESMRLHPVFYAVARRLTHDVELGGYRVPAGYTVFAGIQPVQTDPGQHPEPHLFRPERFLDGSATAANWLPFGAGVRRCLGGGFAMMEATAILREVLRNYRLTAARARPEKPRARHVVYIPAHGARIIAHRRAG